MNPEDLLDLVFPPNGPCAFCGDEIVGARHRVIDALAEHVCAGDSIDSVAEDYATTRDRVVFALGFNAARAMFEEATA